MKTVSAVAEILVRASAEETYAAFVEPAQLTEFWLSAASGPLEVGRRVRWEFRVPGAVDEVEAKTLEPGKRIVVRSKDGSTMAWTFTKHEAGTVVRVEHSELPAQGDELVAFALEATQGFTLVLCGLKARLEKGPLEIVEDKARLIREKKS